MKRTFLEILENELCEVNALLIQELRSGSCEFNELVRPFIESGGKRIRAKLLLIVALGGSSLLEERRLVAAAIEMLHLATLVHDDVLDQAEQRRGISTIHCSKGNKIAILGGDYLFAKAFSLIGRVENKEILCAFTKVIESLVQGEFLQMEDLYNLAQSKERYLLKTKLKTADLLETAVLIGAYLNHWNDKEIVSVGRFGQALGMIFQLTDDIMDYRGNAMLTGKPVGKDLREGLITYPLLAVLHKLDSTYVTEELKTIKAGGDPNNLIELVISEGGIELAEELVYEYEKEALYYLEQLPYFEGRDELRGLMTTLMDRKV